jgi:Ca2+-binding RTX toxin-like protein
MAMPSPSPLLLGSAAGEELNGGAGADTFAFAAPADGVNNRDTVTDFLSGTDGIQFAAQPFSALGPVGALDATTFVAGTEALDAGDRLIYDSSTGSLFYDADGNDVGAAVLVANFGAGTTLAASDIFVV